MNQIRAIQALNKKEIENGISPEASWHVDYRDTAFVYFGGLPYELTEGDIITIFSQFGEPVWLKLARDKETGKSKGFGWLKYEDQRSTDLAVDNLGGATIGRRLVRVDHARYKFRDDEDPDEGKVDWATMTRREREAAGQGPDETEEDESERGGERPMLPQERELALLVRDHDEDDPMKAFLVEEKKKEVEEAVGRYEKEQKRKRRKEEEKEKRERRHRSHRSRRHDSDDEMRDADRDERHKSRRLRRDDTNTDSDREDRSNRRRDSRERERGLDRESKRERRDRDRSRERRDRDKDRDKDRGGKKDVDDDREERRRDYRRRHDRDADNGLPRRRQYKDDEVDDRRYRRPSRSRSRSRSPRPRR
ncbi:hypothetical protein SODALDRAFT_291531 [Sodiomyces alkalinus F11]|uniref:RRM domain-containing protein n=1 Tax=Sodiomyces alkalinus (strain CBS 110278 / VKM F-3762 / F11) TaxID=1314773 RepID=A0A3N2Q2T2_SODAK|nr:hypothetical protein SODALDRAFT_291531 [Sodiomyces alkalinus F11]ROT41036.1 hypothetical protein SODALDRAFT_291531 [Sodiomyces alkalinus F11]